MKVLYKKKNIAFIDVLGFSDIVLNSNTEIINSYFNYLKTRIKEISGDKSISYYFISDTIIISSPSNIDGLYKLLYITSFIQSQLLSQNILTRGALSVGDFYLNKKENMIVGPALVHAYKLESLAKYPRVILDRSIISEYSFIDSTSLLSTVKNKFLENKFHAEILKLDKDNFIYINYLSLFVSRYQHYEPKKTMANFYAFMQRNFFQNQNLEKFTWLKEKAVAEFEIQLELSKISAKSMTKRYRWQRNRVINFIPEWKKKFGDL